jgi:hypothetical protein
MSLHPAVFWVIIIFAFGILESFFYSAIVIDTEDSSNHYVALHNHLWGNVQRVLNAIGDIVESVVGLVIEILRAVSALVGHLDGVLGAAGAVEGAREPTDVSGPVESPPPPYPVSF